MSEKKEDKPEIVTIDPAVASDVDGDGKLDLDPEKAQMTITDLVLIDHKLRDQGTSLGFILISLAKSAHGIDVR